MSTIETRLTSRGVQAPEKAGRASPRAAQTHAAAVRSQPKQEKQADTDTSPENSNISLKPGLSHTQAEALLECKLMKSCPPHLAPLKEVLELIKTRPLALDFNAHATLSQAGKLLRPTNIQAVYDESGGVPLPTDYKELVKEFVGKAASLGAADIIHGPGAGYE